MKKNDQKVTKQGEIEFDWDLNNNNKVRKGQKDFKKTSIDIFDWGWGPNFKVSNNKKIFF